METANLSKTPLLPAQFQLLRVSLEPSKAPRAHDYLSREKEQMMELLRTHIGLSLRSARNSQGRTLREVARQARVSLGYLSEVERGQKEASSELLNSICQALDLELSEVLTTVARELVSIELLSRDTVKLTVVDAA